MKYALGNMLGAGKSSSKIKITSLALFGDSITDQNSQSIPANNTASTYGIGYATQGMLLLGSPFSLVRRVVSAYTDVGDYTFGYGAYSPSDLLNGNRNGDGVYPMQDIATANPSNIFVCAGSNTSSSTASQNAANIITIWDTFIAAGRKVFAAEILPRVQGAGGYDATALQACYDANAILKSAASSRGIPFLEWASVVALSPGGFGDSAFLPDGVHPGTRGAQRLGLAWANFMRPYCLPSYEPPISGSSAWLTTNPYMSGDVSGLATGWTRTNPTGGTTTPSKVTDTDGTVWQRLTISQSGYTIITFRQASGTGTFVAGDVVIPVCRVRSTSSGWDFKGVRLEIYTTISGSTALRYGAHTISNSDAANSNIIDPVNGLIIGMPMTIPANTTAMFTYFQCFGSGTIDVRQIGLVKIA